MKIAKKKGFRFFSESLKIWIVFVPLIEYSNGAEVESDIWLECSKKDFTRGIIVCENQNNYKPLVLPIDEAVLSLELLRNITRGEVGNLRQENYQLLEKNFDTLYEKMAGASRNLGSTLILLSNNSDEYEKFKNNPLDYLDERGVFPFQKGEYLTGVPFKAEEYVKFVDGVIASLGKKELGNADIMAAIATTSTSSLAATRTETHYSFSTGSLSETRTSAGYSTGSGTMAFTSGRHWALKSAFVDSFYGSLRPLFSPEELEKMKQREAESE